MNHKKYKIDNHFAYPARKWPTRKIISAPEWCSVDLRDGNQSLETPMTLEQKIEFFNFLVDIGFKEIEVGFPSASDTEFMFTRTLIEQNLIPADVTIQVLTQSREPLIRRTFEALEGVNQAVVHLYNSTCPLHREVVFGKSKAEAKELALTGARLFNSFADQYGRERFIFEYSPENFSQTEMPYVLEVLNAVVDAWEGRPTILNLPFTVEKLTPNVHADMVEYICANINNREKITISLHAHNDRGTAVAATELCLLAGADRVEGTLFGNGERTGNADLLTLAMNLYSQGIDPKLDFSNVDRAIEIYERITELPVHPRHPYAGSLVFTAFSGSHQDAIRKGLAYMKENPGFWNAPYLPIDPIDVGRNYDPIIRINSQSGRGGVAYILENHGGIQMPKIMHQDFGAIVTKVSDGLSRELTPDEICQLFLDTYIKTDTPAELTGWKGVKENEISHITGNLSWHGTPTPLDGHGEGLVEAFCNAIEKATGLKFQIILYSQNALDASHGSKAKAITYIGITTCDNKLSFGVGVSSSVSTSSIKAIISAVNRL